MVNTSQNFADKYNLKFSTNPTKIAKSKTLCIIFSPQVTARRCVAQIILDSVPLPLVEDLKHLGNIVQSNNSMNIDVTRPPLLPT